MTDLNTAIHAIEEGLLPTHRIQGRPQQPISLREGMARFKVPGFSIALIQDAEIAWTQAYGLQQAGGVSPATGETVTGETVFQAGSISKPVSAMAALRLVQEGALDLDADVNEALRSWQVPESEHTQQHKVTLRGLLSHTAGLTVYGYRGYPAGQDLPTLPQILDGRPPAHSDPVRTFQEPGAGQSYSGGGYVVMQQLLEDVTGQPLADLVQARVLDKLGMADSVMEQPLDQARAARAATAHRGSGDPVPGRWHTYPEQAAAGLWTTPSDLARFGVEILKSHAGQSNAVLSAEMTRQMLTPLSDGWYGLGFYLVETEGRVRFQHPGWNEGYHSFLGGDVSTGQGVAWMSNGENGMLLGLEMMRGLAQALGWSGFEQMQKTVAKVDPCLYARYEGRYQHAAFPEYSAVIVRDGDRLFWEELPDKMRYELYPESETTFFACERWEPISFVTGDDADAGADVEAMMVGPHDRLERVS